MQTLGDRVRIEREAREWSQARLASEVTRRGYKIGQSAIGNLEKKPKGEAKCIVQLAAALDVSPTWLQTGKGPKNPAQATAGAARPLPDTSREVMQPQATLERDGLLPPLILWKSARIDGGRKGAFLLANEKSGETERPVFLRFSENAFAFNVQNDANSPAYRVRDIVLIDPDAPVADLDDCLFTADPAPQPGVESVIGRLIRSTDVDFFVHQYAISGEIKLPRSAFPNAWLIVGRYIRR